MAWVWALRLFPCFGLWPEATRCPSGCRQQNSAALADPASGCGDQTLGSVETPVDLSLDVFFVFGDHSPAVVEADVFVALGVLSNDHADAAF